MYLAANRHVVSMYPDVITSLPIGVQSISACLNVCGFVDISLCPLAVLKTHVQTSRNFLCMLPVAVARSSSDVGWWRSPAVEHWSLADVLSLSCAPLVADG